MGCKHIQTVLSPEKIELKNVQICAITVWRDTIDPALWHRITQAPVRTVKELLALEGYAGLLGKPWGRTLFRKMVSTWTALLQQACNSTAKLRKAQGLNIFWDAVVLTRYTSLPRQQMANQHRNGASSGWRCLQKKLNRKPHPFQELQDSSRAESRLDWGSKKKPFMQHGPNSTWSRTTRSKDLGPRVQIATVADEAAKIACNTLRRVITDDLRRLFQMHMLNNKVWKRSMLCVLTLQCTELSLIMNMTEHPNDNLNAWSTCTAMHWKRDKSLFSLRKIFIL